MSFKLVSFFTFITTNAYRFENTPEQQTQGDLFEMYKNEGRKSRVDNFLYNIVGYLRRHRF